MKTNFFTVSVVTLKDYSFNLKCYLKPLCHNPCVIPFQFTMLLTAKTQEFLCNYWNFKNSFVPNSSGNYIH